MLKKTWIAAAAAVAVGAAAVALAETASAPAKAAREFTTVNLEYQGSKVWVPATYIVKKGETVRIKLINEAPSGKHGFAIDEFGVKTTVFNGKPETVEFEAKEAGLFRVYCQLHGAHVGGQLLVLDK